MRKGTALVAFALALAAAAFTTAAAPRRAVLLRGADTVKGLPFFAPNAIVALSGLYALDKSAPTASPDGSDPGAGIARGPAAQVAVWFSREGIVFAPAWKRVDSRAFGSYSDVAYSLESGGGTVLALKSEGYTLFFELGGDPRAADFARAFAGKFPIFFRNAASDAELSFPAYVDY
jgi:hypothetical protein